MELLKKLFRRKKDVLKYPDIHEAMKTIRIELAKDQSDGSYYYAWQANLAIAFYDEMKNYCEKNNIALYIDLHEISNNAAKRFLNLLIR